MNYQFLNVCNGYSFSREEYSLPTISLFKERYKDLKDHAKQLLGGRNDVWFAERFHNPSDVLGRITSVAYEHEFLKNPDEWILDAFRDCAQADYWYTFEKNYE